ncbi:formate dehydrogenase accessory protein FdhE [Paucibacter sp. R3-3]|uniref:Protein FdhE homolog n=1 Tax=Roseateles agri TaxID=3098619 RepID=A0ABU5DPH3_9BURK|nr:formate dehydrogenase accessory protein FdhE [Paucibacter sp. R3-3]MDY0748220.1 formate dehydrogenase accessory protein FdhE [Paucibacter sp. R3-3]
MTGRILSPEEIAVRAGRADPFLRLPDATVFAEREMRLRQRAAGHAMREYLLFIADVAHAQHELLQQLVALQLPDVAQVELAANAGVPLLPADVFPREAAWREGLRALLDKLLARTAAVPALAMLATLREADDAHLDMQAQRLLNGVMLGLDLGSAPLIGAALQLHWVRLVSQTQAAHGQARVVPFGRTDVPTLCPCCGSRPVAAITRLGAELSGTRYLHCSLCAAEWHYVRIKCTHCQNTKGIHFQELEGGTHAAQAECCDECGHYLKIVHMEKDHQVDPVADDLASLTLDLLVSETGLQRSGVNLMLLFGDPEPPPDPGGP